MPMTNEIRPTRMCRYCNKEVINLTSHIINMHPKVLEQIEEISQELPPSNTNFQTPPQNPGVSMQRTAPNDINTMIREKLDIMLNIKIIEMLSKNPDTSLGDIKKAIEPTQNTTLQDIKMYHDMLWKDTPMQRAEDTGGGNQWLDLVNNALPIIAQMLPAKREEIKNVTERRSDEERSPGILRPISQEIAGNTTESRSISEEPRTVISTEQQNSANIDTISKRS